MFPEVCPSALVGGGFLFPGADLLSQTAGKTLEEIDYLFGGDVPAWESAKLNSRFDEKVDELKSKGDPERGESAAIERTQ